ncbi:MAG: hypothetical protein JW861_14510 [Bacteroidales bacterium]|nr:hypothetical protein [Bacteroidales bacterium]
MNRNSIFVMLVALLAACSPKYWSDSSISPAYQHTMKYRVAVMPVAITGIKEALSIPLNERAYAKITMELMKQGNFSLLDRSVVDQTTRIRAFSNTSNTMDLSLAKEVGKEAGADLVVVSMLSRESEGMPVLAEIQIVEIERSEPIYMGKGRAENPLSVEAGTEVAIEAALSGLSGKKSKK